MVCMYFRYAVVFLLLVTGRCSGHPTNSANEISLRVADAAKSERSIDKRELEALDVGKFLLDVCLAAGSIYFPPAGVVAVAVSFFWPSGKDNTFERIKTQVEAVIDEKIKAEFFKNLQTDVNNMKSHLTTYVHSWKDSSYKVEKLISVDTAISDKRGHFMRYKDNLVFLQLFAAYGTLELGVKMDLYNIVPEKEKANRAKDVLTTFKKNTAYLGDLTYGGFEEWRRNQFSCKVAQTHGMPILQRSLSKRAQEQYTFVWTWTDKVTGTTKTKKLYRYTGTFDYKVPDPKSWCAGFQDPIMNKLQPVLTKLRKNVQDWATVFNFFAKDTAGKHGSISLTSCMMGRGNQKTYFGHYNKDSSGRTCDQWSSQWGYHQFPMDNNDKKVASNYCRRTENSNGPWCYSNDRSTWGYCSIRACGSSDWL